jgi:hypothetical protein
MRKCFICSEPHWVSGKLRRAVPNPEQKCIHRKQDLIQRIKTPSEVPDPNRSASAIPPSSRCGKRNKLSPGRNQGRVSTNRGFGVPHSRQLRSSGRIGLAQLRQ